MAWIHRTKLNQNAGRYPLHEGEYCGNYNALQAYICYHPLDKNQHRRYLSGMFFGLPRQCMAFTVEQGLAAGFVGLYLSSDNEPSPHHLPVTTPPQLMMPGADTHYSWGASISTLVSVIKNADIKVDTEEADCILSRILNGETWWEPEYL